MERFQIRRIYIIYTSGIETHGKHLEQGEVFK